MLAVIVLAARNGGAMQIQADTEVSLFVRDRVTATGFQSKGHQGPWPRPLAQRGYSIDGDVASPAIVPEDGSVNVPANG
jgi:hypothetical protein